MIIGLTGMIASGKSLVSSRLRSYHNIPVIDADAVAKSLMNKGMPVYNGVVEAFGNEILDKNGNIDSHVLAGIVFANEEKLTLLNSITHPQAIKSIMSLANEELQKGARVVFVESALLLSSGMDKYTDEIWAVVAEEDIRIKRLMERNNVSMEDALKRIRAQRDGDKMVALASCVIENNTDIQDLYSRVDNIVFQRGFAFSDNGSNV
ncbi:MAG: dephospho-CoA kinase [Clostridiales bacterium]|nr:dephospho-CoA kinase [Clostridiales bacterium]